MANDIRLLSGRVKKTPATDADPGRYEFLDLQNAEPDLGVPAANGNPVISNTDGTREWAQVLELTTDQANVLGNLSVTGNITATNFVGNITGNVDAGGANTQVQFNDGDILAGSSGFTFDKASNLVTVSGNVLAANLVTSGQVTATGNISGGNVAISGQITATGNVVGGNLTTAGQVSATGNITGNNLISDNDVTTVTVTASGNVAGGNVTTVGRVDATGNVTGGNVNTAGQIMATGNVSGGNLVSALDVSTVTVTASGNVSGGNINSVNAVTGASLAILANAAVGNLAVAQAITTDTLAANNTVAAANVLTNAVSGSAIVIYGTSVDFELTGNVDLSGSYIKSLANPVQAQDAATKQYVDDAVSSGIQIHEPVDVESPGPLPSSTYTQGGNIFTVTDTVAGNTVVFSTAANLQVNDQLWFANSFQGIVGNLSYFVVSTPNTSAAILSTAYDGIPVSNITSASSLTESVRVNPGIGATLTATANGALTIDGFSVSAGNRALIYEQVLGLENGVYVVTDSGNATAPWILTRSSDTDTYEPNSTTGLDDGSYFYVKYGSTGAGESYVKTAPSGAFIIGLANIVFTQFSASQVYSANTQAGLVLNGTIFSAKIDSDTTYFDPGGNIAVRPGANLVTPNIGDAVGNSLTLSGNGLLSATTVTVSGNVSAGNVNSNNAVTAVTVAASGNISGNNIVSSNDVATATVTASGNVTGANLNTAGLVLATGNITGGNITTSGTVAATGNITGGNINTVGQISATGNVTGGNLISAADVTTVTVTASGNITGNNLISNNDITTATVSASGNITGNNVTATNTVTTIAVLASGNITGNNLVSNNDVTTATVTASGNVAGGNITTGGVVVATGNITGGNINTGSRVVATGNVTGGNITTVGQVVATGNVSGGNVNTAGNVTASYVIASDGIIGNVTITDLFVGNITANGFANITGNIIGGNIVSNGEIDATGNITSNNLVSNNDVTTTTVTAIGNVAGGNITTAGQVIATGNVTGGNITTAGDVTGGTATITGNVSGETFLGNVVGSYGNFTGNVTAANFIGNIQGNIDAGGANTQVQFNDSDILAGSPAFTFDKTSNLVSVSGNVSAANLVSSGVITATGNVAGGNITTAGRVDATGNITGGNVDIAGQVVAAGNVSGGNVISSNDVTTVTVTASGNILGNNLVSNNDVTTATVTASGNISGNNLVSNNDVTTATVTASGNVAGGNIITSGVVTATGNVTGANLVTPGGVSANTGTFTGNLSAANLSTTGMLTVVTISASGNITGNNLVSNNDVTAVTVTASGNISGNNLISNNDVTTTTVIATGNIAGGNITTGGTVAASGNVSGGNVNTVGQVVATGNVTSGNLVSLADVTTVTVTALGNIQANNIQAQNTVSAVTGDFSGNVSATTLQGNLEATEAAITGNVSANNATITNDLVTGTLETTGNALIGGNLSVQGNLTYINVTDLRVEDPVIIMGTGPNGNALTQDDGKDCGIYMEYYKASTQLGNAFVGWDNSTGNLIAATNATITNDVVTVVQYGTFQGGNLYIESAQVLGNVLANNVQALTEISAPIFRGNVSGNTAVFTGNVQADYFTGNIDGANINIVGNLEADWFLGNIDGNVGVFSGNVTAANFIGNVVGNITGNISAGGANTQVQFNDDGLLAGSTGFTFDRSSNLVTVAGNVSAANFLGNIDGTQAAFSSNVSAANFVGTGSNVRLVAGSYVWTFDDTGNTSLADGTVTGNVLSLTGNVSAAGAEFTGNVQADTLLANVSGTTALFTGNVSGGNVITGGSIDATGNVTGGNIVTAGVVSAGTGSFTGNVTAANVNTAGSVGAATVAVSGNVSGGNLVTVGTVSGASATITGNVSGETFLGNVEGNSAVFSGNVTAANFIGNVQGNISGNVTAAGANTQVQYNNDMVTAGSPAFTFDNSANLVTVLGNISATYFVGDGSQLTGIYANANVADFLANFGSNSISTTGNISAGNILATYEISADIMVASGNVTANNVSITNTVSSLTLEATGNVSGGNLTTLGEVSAAAVVASGNVTGNTFLGNVEGNSAVFSGNVTADYFIGNIQGNIDAGGANTQVQFNDDDVLAGSAGFTFDKTSNIVTVSGNVSAQYFVGNVDGDTAIFTGNVEAGNLQATSGISAASGLISGNLSAANLDVANEISTVTVLASGNVSVANLLASGSLEAAGADILGNITAVTLLANVEGNSAVFTGTVTANNFAGNIDAGGSDTQIQFNDNDVLAGSAALTFDKTSNVVTVTGNVAAYDFLGNISGTTATFTGNATAENLVANNTLFAASVSSSGNVSAANIAATFTVTANSVQVSSNVTAANIEATDSVSGTTISASGNVTGGNLVSLADVTTISVTASGNVQGNNIISANDVTTDTVTASGNVSANNIISANDVTTDTVTASGNVTGGNIVSLADISTVTVTASGNIQAGNVEITDLLSANIITASGNVQAGNIDTAGSVTVGTIDASGNITTQGFFIGTFAGNISGNLTAPGANTQILFNQSGNAGASAALVFDYGANVLTVDGAAVITGNITAGNVISNADVTTVTVSASGNVSGNNIISANDVTTVTVSASGNVSGNNIISANDVATVTVSATGNISAANVTASAEVAAANVTATYVNAGTLDTDAVTGGNITVTADSVAFVLTGNVDVGSRWINSLANPEQAQDAATKQYVDDAVSSGIHIHTPVDVESPGPLPAATYNQGGNVYTVTDTVAGNIVVFSTAANLQPNDQLWFTSSFDGIVANLAYFVVSTPNTSAAVLSTSYDGEPVANITGNTGLSESVRVNSGQGANLVATANGALTIDGFSVSAGNRVLVYEQNTALENGIYVVTDAGNVSAPWILTRSSDADTYRPNTNDGLDQGSYFFVLYGDTGAGESYVMTQPSGAFILGLNSVEFTQFSTSPVYQAGNGLSLNGTTFSVNVDDDTTAIVADTVVVKAGANLVTPNIGDATGNSLTLSGNGLLSATTVSASGNVQAGNIQASGEITADTGVFTGNIQAGNANIANDISAASVAVSGNVTAGNISTAGTLDVADITVSGNVTAQTFLGNVQGDFAVFSGNVEAQHVITNSLRSDDSTVILIQDGLYVSGDVDVQGNVQAQFFLGNVQGDSAVFTGNVAADYFLGNGSLLTGISVDTARIFNGLSEVDIPVANGNVNISVDSTTNVAVFTSAGVVIDGSGDFSGNVSANYFLGNGSQLTGINAFGVISVSGESDVTADSVSDTLTLVAGTGITITTDAGNDSISIASFAAPSIFATGGNMGFITQSVTSSEDLGVVTDLADLGYTLGTITVNGLVVDANILDGTITGDKLSPNIDIVTTGNITADVFFGDGSQLTGISASGNRIFNGDTEIDIASSNADITMSVDGSANVVVVTSLGAEITALIMTGNIDVGNNYIVNLSDPLDAQDAATKSYVDSQISSGFTIEDDTANTTVVAGGDTLQLLGTADQIQVEITDIDQVTFALPANVTVTGNIQGGNLVTGGDVTTDTVTASGNITGQYFFGNGSQLTGVSSSSDRIFNGTSNITIPAANSAANISIGNTANVVIITDQGIVLQNNIVQEYATVTTSVANSQVTLDSWSSLTYRSARYYCQVTGSTDYEVIELSMIHDGANVYLTQYGQIVTNTSLGNFDASLAANSVSVLWTPVSAVTTVKASVTLIAV